MLEAWLCLSLFAGHLDWAMSAVNLLVHMTAVVIRFKLRKLQYICIFQM